MNNKLSTKIFSNLFSEDQINKLNFRLVNRMFSSLNKFLFQCLPSTLLIKLINTKSSYLLNISKIDTNVYRVDSDNLYIYISRPKRLFKYKYGIRARLREIEAKYFTDQIRFNNNDVVIDCGSNIGELALAIRLKKNIRIFAIEPDKIELKVLKLNLKKHDVIFNHFVSDKSSIQKIVYENETGDTRIILDDEVKFTSQHVTQIKTRTLDQLLAPYKLNSIKLLKIEVEGLEPEVLKGCKEILKITKFVAIDTGPERNGKNTFDDCVKQLSLCGFKKVFANNQASVLFKKK